MAKIWFVKQGAKPTLGEAPYQRSLEWCVDNLSLLPSHWIAPLESPQPFGESTSLDAYRSPRFVVVEVEDQDTIGP